MSGLGSPTGLNLSREERLARLVLRIIAGVERGGIRPDGTPYLSVTQWMEDARVELGIKAEEA